MRFKLAGYAHLARMIDKCRAVLAGTEGEYIYPCPMDERLMEFAGITSDQFTSAVKANPTDEGVVKWLEQTAKPHQPASWKNGIRSCWHADRVLLKVRPGSKNTWPPSIRHAPISPLGRIFKI